MDAAEFEQDAQLQKAAAGLLADFQSSLKPFLWKTLHGGRLQVRRRVRAREVERLLRLLNPFQELPQLLDPYLEKFLPVLADAYLESLRSNPLKNTTIKHVTLLVPLPAAICQLLYTFCKIRGEKVIVRFLSAETRNLELLLSAIETAETSISDDALEMNNSSRSPTWTWEERYICLLWLSHLLLAPFDLSSISSAGTADIEISEITGLVLPENVPGVALRVIPLAVKYLASAGKERDAAKALLIRITMRKDMQELGLLHALVYWALSKLKSSALVVASSVYSSVGVLSYLGGVLVSSTNTSDMDPYLLEIFQVAQDISSEDQPTFNHVHTSALARKIIIKILRTITVRTLLMKSAQSHKGVESTIGHLLEALADNDTPVRLAASKAISVITLQLAPIMAAQVVEAILDSLNHNVLWLDEILGQKDVKIRDLSAVNPLEWHGLILSLSHLLYRRSPPADSLSDILHALLIGLSFERRSTSGSSVGTNVRDAACFGIWALSRRYTTIELQSISKSSVFATKQHDSSASIIQVLATELVVSASLDPAGNIRRGASAALQELIGRHPDTVAEGIAVVQVVDYHAVALRSRAMLEVSSKAARLSAYYQNALLEALFAWRGIGDGDATSRRNAATAIGLLVKDFKSDVESSPWHRINVFMERIETKLSGLKPRENDLRHGLFLSMAAVLSSMADALDEIETVIAATILPHMPTDILTTMHRTFEIVLSILEDAKSSSYRRPELVAEGVSQLILAVTPVLAFGSPSINATTPHYFPRTYGQGVISEPRIIDLADSLLILWLRRDEPEVVASASAAAVSFVSILGPAERHGYVGKWIQELSEDARGHVRVGYSLVLAAVFPLVGAAQQDEICEAFLGAWQATSHVESKIAILQSLSQSRVLHSRTSQFIGVIADGLDDYTVDGRGDIGSLIRVEALKAARKAFDLIPWTGSHDENEGSECWFQNPNEFSKLYSKILRLSAEKLDRVRSGAQHTLAKVCRNESERTKFESFSPSSFEYFRWLLDLQTADWLNLPFLEYQPGQWHTNLLEGLVTSADTGSEDLIRVSRAALADFCYYQNTLREISPIGIDPRQFVCQALFEVAKKEINNDRVLVSTLEVMSYLFDVGVMQESKIEWRSLYLLVQKAHFKTVNVRKLEAAIKLYGGIVQVYPEALQKLTSMLLHPFPTVRIQVADTLFAVRGIGKGVDWTRARKKDLDRLKAQLNEGI